MRQALDAGPAASGRDEDQRWTLARVADLIRRLFHVSYLDQLAAVVRRRLRRIQRQPGLIAGFLGQTGLKLEPGPP